MTKALHITEMVKGGVASYLKGLLAEQSQDPQWSNFRIIASRQQCEYLSPIPKEQLITYDYPSRNPLNLRELARVSRQTIREFQPDVIHLHSTFPGVIGRAAGIVQPLFKSSQSPKVIYTPHGWSFRRDSAPWKRSIYHAAERFLARRSDCLLCVSNDELAGALSLGVPLKKCRRVYNGIPVECPAAEPVELPIEIQQAKARGEIVLLFMGRYDRQKGLDLLLPAMQAIQEKPIWLICVGGEVVGEHKHLEFSKKTVELGWVTPGQIQFLLEQCDAMIAPSRWEGLPISGLEAIRAGRAVISSRAGGLEDIVDDGKNGILFPELSTSSIVQVLKTLDRDQLEAFGDAAQEKFLELFTSPVMYEATRSLYQSVLTGQLTSTQPAYSPAT